MVHAQPAKGHLLAREVERIRRAAIEGVLRAWRSRRPWAWLAQDCREEDQDSAEGEKASTHTSSKSTARAAGLPNAPTGRKHSSASQLHRRRLVERPPSRRLLTARLQRSKPSPPRASTPPARELRRILSLHSGTLGMAWRWRLLRYGDQVSLCSPSKRNERRTFSRVRDSSSYACASTVTAFSFVSRRPSLRREQASDRGWSGRSCRRCRAREHRKSRELARRAGADSVQRSSVSLTVTVTVGRGRSGERSVRVEVSAR